MLKFWPLKVISCSTGGNQENTDFLKPIIEKLGMQLIRISEWPEHEVMFKIDTWLQELSKADIVVCAQRECQPAKSNNRATQAMALGKPVICSPLLAYKEVIVHGVNGYIAQTPEEWENCLIKLQDSQLRKSMGKAAKESVKDYSIESIGKQWMGLIDTLHKNLLPKVDIIITTRNQLEYLKLCVESIKTCTDTPYNIIVINSGCDGTAQWLAEQGDIIYHNCGNATTPDDKHFSAHNNIGLQIGKEAYACILNDDTIVSYGWLRAMLIEAMKENGQPIGAVGCFSNCDQGWTHQDKIIIENVDLHPAMKPEQVKNIISKIYEYKHKHELAGTVHERDWVAFYATLFPRAVMDKVGNLDEEFKTGCEDVDYCRRIKACGYKIVQTYASWVFHFGGITRKAFAQADPDKNQREDNYNQQLLKEKSKKREKYIYPYGLTQKKVLVLFTGQALEKWDRHSIDKGGIGGSETCAAYLCEEFARRNYDVHLFGDPVQESIINNVTWHPWEQINHFSTPIDTLIFSRCIHNLPGSARRLFVWVHDVFLSQTRQLPDYTHVDKFVCLSPWHAQFFCEHHMVPPGKVAVIGDAIDLSRFENKIPRQRGKIIYSSSPDRGLEKLLTIFPTIKKAVPEANIHVYYGFANWIKMNKNDPKIKVIQDLMQQDGVFYHGRIGQWQLAQEFLSSELWVMPTWFTETFCITAVEAQAAGVPCVCTDLAALHTTAAGQVLLNLNDPRWAEICIELLYHKDKWQIYSDKGREAAKKHTWPNVVDQWLWLAGNGRSGTLDPS